MAFPQVLPKILKWEVRGPLEEKVNILFNKYWKLRRLWDRSKFQE